MTRPSQAQFNAVIRSMNGLLAYKKLRSMGYDVTQLECREARTAFTGKGYKQNRVIESTEAERITRIGAKVSSDALEKAICALYAKTAKRLGCKLETASIVLNYSPTQIAKMGRAA